MNQPYEFESLEAEAKALSVLSLEERILFRKRQYKARVTAREAAEQAALAQQVATLEAQRAEANRLQKQRQAANRAARAAEINASATTATPTGNNHGTTFHQAPHRQWLRRDGQQPQPAPLCRHFGVQGRHQGGHRA